MQESNKIRITEKYVIQKFDEPRQPGDLPVEIVIVDGGIIVKLTTKTSIKEYLERENATN